MSTTAKRKTRSEMLDGFEDLGGVFLDVDEGFRNADYANALGPILARLEQTHADGWSREGSPSGEKWKSLAWSTITKKGHRLILIDSGRLKSSLTARTGDSVREVSHRGLLFGTQVPYSIFHQRGGRRLPKREHVGMNEETCQQIVDVVADATVEALKL